MNKNVNYNKHYYNDSLKEFENLNTTTRNIYELDNYSILVVLDDGRNLTSLDQIDDNESVVYISEDLKNTKKLTRRYSYPNLKAIVTQNMSPNIKSTSYMFYSCKNLTTVSGLDTWDTSHLKDSHGMFKNCNKLTHIYSMKDWNMSNVVDTSSMFENCNSLSSLGDLINWDTTSIEDMTSMFEDCTGLNNLDGLSDWNMKSVKSIDRMFENCMNLCDIDSIAGWNLPENISKVNMFRDCLELDEEKIVHFNSQPKNKSNHHLKENVIQENTNKHKNIINKTKTTERVPTDNIVDYEVDGFFDYSSDLDYVMKVLTRKYGK
ncbi:BspA family leucine-rich repeat surface protein [Methanosphaera sp. BMS]|uniref:BspA family leucine-rich repeat surface protein n=1 Tax=Methanosphaera sp. BMS TaxID=1789762 RepID=UPI000DC1C5D3|nr:BspA family leucine-rich repeat surface protein [Methanosphaera sp. BMS]AWX31708.1 hypothetical protein AW729_00775 [Methanosphaera sp. BMS]